MRKRVADCLPCGLVQVVHVRWEKSARGGQGARDRNSVLAANVVLDADLVGIGSQLGVGVSKWSECNAFAAPISSHSQRIAIADGYAFGCVRVTSHRDGLQLHYEYGYANGGAPDRSFLNWPSASGESPGRSIVVRHNEWVRVCYNGRFSCFDSGNWWYEQTTINVAFFDGEPNGRVFLDREPSQELRALADLW